MKEPLTQYVADWFGAVDCWIDEVESVLDRHLEQELELYIAREPAREDEFRTYFESERSSGVVGDVVAATTPLEETTADAVMAQVDKLGAIQIPLAELYAKLRILEDFRSRYESREYFHSALADVTRALNRGCLVARSALDAAAHGLTEHLKSLPEKARTLGKTIDGKTLLSMIDVAVLTGTSVDAARKLVREKGLTVHRIGKPKYVVAEDFFAATREDPPSPATAG